LDLSADAFYNNMTGDLPDIFTALLPTKSTLTTINLNSNFYINGPIPDSIGLFTALQVIDFTQLDIESTIPASLNDLTQLTNITLSIAGIEGTIPDLSGLVDLQAFSAILNLISGSLPAFFGDLPHLTTLSLSSNNMSGTIPTSIVDHTFTSLQIDNNLFTGAFPWSAAQSAGWDSASGFDARCNLFNNSAAWCLSSDTCTPCNCFGGTGLACTGTFSTSCCVIVIQELGTTSSFSTTATTSVIPGTTTTTIGTTGASATTGISGTTGIPGSTTASSSGTTGSNTGSIKSDPHFTGFQGEDYKVTGDPDKLYSLVSEENLQINGKFTIPCHEGTPGTIIISQMGVMVDNHKISVDLKNHFIVDNVPLRHPTTITFSDNLAVTLQHEQLMVFKTPNFSFFIQHLAPTGVLFDGTDCIPGYLNLVFMEISMNSQAHGLLGQTLHHHHVNNTQRPDAWQGEGEIEGVYTDYEVSSLFGTDNKFNLFHKSF